MAAIKHIFLEKAILYSLHAFNDGFQASYLLLLPFIAHDIHINLTQVGFLGTLLSSVGIVLSLPAGYLAKHFGGMRVILLASLLYAAGFFLTGFGYHYYYFLLFFILSGVGYSLFHPIGFALIAQKAEKGKRGREMGNFTAIGDMGRIGIAALITFCIAWTGWRFTAFLYGSIALFIALLILGFFLRKKEEAVATDTKKGTLGVWHILKNKQFLFATSAGLFDTFASSSLFVFLPFLLLKKGIDPAFLGSFTAVFFIGNFFGKVILGRFGDTFAHTIVFIFSEISMFLIILLLANTSLSSIIILCSFILGIFTKGTIPLVQTMVSESAEQHGHFEKTFGLNTLAASIATTIAPLLLGYISDRLGVVSAFNIMACMALLAILPAFAFHKMKRNL